MRKESPNIDRGAVNYRIIIDPHLTFISSFNNDWVTGKSKYDNHPHQNIINLSITNSLELY